MPDPRPEPQLEAHYWPHSVLLKVEAERDAMRVERDMLQEACDEWNIWADGGGAALKAERDEALSDLHTTANAAVALTMERDRYREALKWIGAADIASSTALRAYARQSLNPDRSTDD